MFSRLFGKKQKPEPEPSPQSIYQELREQILTTSPNEVGIFPSEENPNAWGVVMETGYPEGAATLVSLADGTTSLYLEGGGGLIGGGGHEHIAYATKAVVRDAENYYGSLTQTISFPLPAVDNVRFFILTYSGAYTIEVNEEDLGEGRHYLSPLFFKCHDVLTILRELNFLAEQLENSSNDK